MKGQLVTVRFKDPILLGRSMEPMSALSDGQALEGCYIKLAYYNDVFMCVTFPERAGRAQYSQYIPWVAVGTAIFDDKPADEPSREQVAAVAQSITDDALAYAAMVDREVAQKKARGRPRKV